MLRVYGRSEVTRAVTDVRSDVRLKIAVNELIKSKGSFLLVYTAEHAW